jgi:flagellin-specific chaperone FliS
MTDLKFIELVTRRLTNAQVKIKAEVAESNMQSQVISQTVAELERHIDACEHPNLDKVTVSPSQLCESLDQLYNLIAHRVTNLNCLKDPAKLQTQMSVRIASPSDTSVSTG